nr:cell death regulator Aven [Loxodonta africana]
MPRSLTSSSRWSFGFLRPCSAPPARTPAAPPPQGRLRGGPAPVRSAPRAEVRCRRNEEPGEAAGGGPTAIGPAETVTGTQRERRWREAAAGNGGGRRGRGRGQGFCGRGRGRGAPRGGRREQRGRGAWFSAPVEDDSDAETCEGENDDQGNYSKRKIVSNWDRYQDTEKEADNESGESQRGTDFSVLLSSAGDSFSQFRFAEEKEWDGEASCPKQNSALYVDCQSLVQALQELPLSLRLNVAAELVQTTIPLELPQVKTKRNDDGKGLGMQLKGPLGSAPELKSAASCSVYPGRESSRPGPSRGSENPVSGPQSAADHLEEELDLLLNLDAPVKGDILPDQTSQDLKAEEDGKRAQEGEAPVKPSVTEEKNVGSEQPSTSKNVTEEDLEDWLDSMIA